MARFLFLFTASPRQGFPIDLRSLLTTLKFMGFFGRVLLATLVLLGGIGAEPARAVKTSCCCETPVPLPEDPCGCPAPEPGSRRCPGGQSAPTAPIAAAQSAPETRLARAPRREPAPCPTTLTRLQDALFPEALPAQAIGARGSPPPRLDAQAEYGLIRI